MGEALAVIKRDVKDMRPEVREARDGVIKLTEWKGQAEKRLEVLDKKAGRAHDCAQVEIIANLQEKSREASVEFATQKAAIIGANEELKDAKASRSTLIYAIIGIMVTVLGTVGGWVWTLSSLQTEVKTLREQQQQVSQEVRQVGSQTKVQTEEVLKRVQQNTAQQQSSDVSFEPLESVVNKMSQEDRNKLLEILRPSNSPNYAPVKGKVRR
jgi:hypothetical protein